MNKVLNKKFLTVLMVLLLIVTSCIITKNSDITFDIGNQFNSWHAYKTAAKFYDLTVNLDRKNPDKPLYVKSKHLVNIIFFYINKLEYDKSKKYLNELLLIEKQNLKTFKSIDQWNFLIFNSINYELSTIYYLQGNYDKSEGYAKKNLCTYKQMPNNCYPFITKDIFKKWRNSSQKHLIDYKSFERLGYTSVQQQKYEQSKKLFDEYFNKESRREIKYYYNLSYLYIKQKNYKLAEEYLNKVLNNNEFMKTSLHGNFYNDFLTDLNESLSGNDVEVFRKTSFLNLKALMLIQQNNYNKAINILNQTNHIPDNILNPASFCSDIYLLDIYSKKHNDSAYKKVKKSLYKKFKKFTISDKNPEKELKFVCY